MTPLQPTSNIFYQGNPILFDDAEMLQTDVMRFFAILCLCLMAIFALVKTLPMAPPDTRPAMIEPGDQKTEAKQLQDKVADLKKKLAEIQSRVKTATVAAEHASSQAVNAAKTEEAALDRVVKARQALAKISQTLDNTRRELESKEVNLGQILKDIAEKRHVRAELNSQVEKEVRSLTKIREQMKRVQEKLNNNHPQSQEIAQKPPQAALPPKPDPEGFTLRFASDDALEKLIASGKVNFYALAGKKAWKIRLSGGSPIYIAADFPRQIYEMETHTVPVDYVAVFQRQIAVFGRRTLTWGVSLPGRTADSINQMVRSRKGGDLIITADGEVKLN